MCESAPHGGDSGRSRALMYQGCALSSEIRMRQTQAGDECMNFSSPFSVFPDLVEVPENEQPVDGGDGVADAQPRAQNSVELVDRRRPESQNQCLVMRDGSTGVT